LRLFIPLILAFYANASFALSFGDATLKSYLGESLIVKLNVTDVEKSPDSNCLTITDTNETPAFRKAFSTLTPYKDGYQLTITTQTVITEPILGLRVSYNCEPQLNRDYVLLLDPAPHRGDMPNTTSTTNQANDINNQSPDASHKTNTLSTTNHTTEAVSANNTTSKPQTKVKRKSKKRQSNLSTNANANSADQKIMEAYVGKQQSSAKQTPAASATPATDNSDRVTPIKPSTSSKPYLSISGGSQTPDTLGGQANLGLKFETQIDLNRAPPIAAVDNAEMMDEVTVMTNRLTHLEKQIVSLQAQNSQLRNEAILAKKELESKQFSWLDYLLIATGGAILIAALEWLRRTFIARRLIKQELNWLDTEDTDDGDDEPAFSVTTPAADNKPTRNNSFSASFLDEQADGGHGKVESTKTGTLSFTEHVNDDHDSIIDNADVFIEHERPLLAIQLLQNHLNDFPMESPKIWLKLLSLIAAEGSETEYETATADANKYFNIRVPSYSEAKNEDHSSIEDFSNIVARLEGVWGSPFAVKFLNDLIYDQYAQPAEGFSANNFEELFFLKRIAELLNTGVSTSQRTLYRTASTTPNDDSPARTNLDNLAFNEAAFGDDLLLEQALPTETTEKPNNSAITDEDFTVASFLDTPEQVKPNKLTKEEANSQFENSAFQKVPSYDVDMLVDFDDHIEVEVPTLNDDANSPQPTQDMSQPLLEKSAEPHETTEELHFPLNVYPEETTSEDSTATKIKDKPTPKNGKDSNIIEWDLPKLDS